MKSERIKILDLLSKGHISADIAESLLKALDQKDQIVAKTQDSIHRQLIVEIKTEDGDDINIKIPLEFAKLLNSKQFTSKIDEDKFDIDIEEIIALASSGMIGELVNIKTGDGDTIIIKVV